MCIAMRVTLPRAPPPTLLRPLPEIFYGCRGPAAHVEFLGNMVHIRAHGFQIDAELFHDFLGDEPFYEQIENLLLAPVDGTLRGDARPMSAPCAAFGATAKSDAVASPPRVP